MSTNINSENKKDKLMPVVYIPHGAGPMPLLGEPGHQHLCSFLKDLPRQLPTPKVILMISAHWETDAVRVSSSTKPAMIYDYGGFPAETYEYLYPAPGQPEFAQTVTKLLAAQNIKCSLDELRGYDHGTFVPLMLMYPEASIPVVQVSLLHSLDPAKHIALGQALSALREQDALIIGSGMSFHNAAGTPEDATAFDNWLNQTLVSGNPDNAKNELTHWAAAPAARACHQREEHLLPLHVCWGAADGHLNAAQNIYSGTIFGRKISGFIWQ